MRTTLTLAVLAVAGAFAFGLSACSTDHHDSMDDMDHHGDSMGDMDHHDDAMPMADLKKVEPSADYPLDTCVVSGEKLGGDMGAPVAYMYDGTEIQFCCPGCVDDFKKDPAKYVAMVKEAGDR